MEIWRYEALETYCKCNDVEAWASGGMKYWRHAAGVTTWRHGDLEV
jgi:hypothetical protein